MIGSITIDLDTLFSHYRNYGLKSNYQYEDFIFGCANFLKMLKKFNIVATFFLVGEDINPWTRTTIQEIINQGHEIACHSFNHYQHIRHLSPDEFEKQISKFRQITQENFALIPAGFRSPGYNIDSKFISVLLKNGYVYDASLFPSSLNPILKMLNFWTMRGKTKNDRTSLGSLKHMFAPLEIYKTDEKILYRRGQSQLIEFPTTMTPYLRLPFCATFHLALGYNFFLRSFHAILNKKLPIIYNFHLFDFVDFNQNNIKDKINFQSGCYRAQSIAVSLEKKLNLFSKVITTMANDYQFLPLKQIL